MRVQTGALPYRMKEGRAEILLVTGRRSGRWSIPKGWPIFGKSLASAAAQEAFEEAGVRGMVEPEPIGAYRHVKRHRLLGTLEVSVVVHPLAVDREADDWPERGQRTRKWFTLTAAARSVDSDELRGLIVELGRIVAARSGESS